MPSAFSERQSSTKRTSAQRYCGGNARKFMRETTLHGLKFVADSSITVWERLFFLLSFIAALVCTCNLISNIYDKWNSTPVIIGISPQPTSILRVPFPAVTVCNMNQALRSKVANYSDDSYENALLKLLCLTDTEFDESLRNTSSFKNNSLQIAEFVVKHAQPCSKMLVICKFSSRVQNCSDLFREVITDEGLCCVFNMVHPDFLYKRKKVSPIKSLPRNTSAIPVDWNLETGYPAKLPANYYPQPGPGTGVSMGLSLWLNAELDEYYCSSTNGAGFKITLHNPIETPYVKEAGLTVPVGFETRFRIDGSRSEAVPNIRSIHRNIRQCIFNDEEELLFYKYYTRDNCESECLAKYLFESCQCLPYNLPFVFANASTCSVEESLCIHRAEKEWLGKKDQSCRAGCLPNCFDLFYMPDSFSSPLSEGDYIISSSSLNNMSKEYVKKNIAIIHFYYRESVFYGDLKNVYIGLTEFLSNTGGIMGLFMGFSFISVAEVLYFICLRPVFHLISPHKSDKLLTRTGSSVKQTPEPDTWQGGHLHSRARPQKFVPKAFRRYKHNHHTSPLDKVDQPKYIF